MNVIKTIIILSTSTGFNVTAVCKTFGYTIYRGDHREPEAIEIYEGPSLFEASKLALSYKEKFLDQKIEPKIIDLTGATQWAN